MVIPYPEDAKHYRMTSAAYATYQQMELDEQGRFRVTMQTPPFSMNIATPMIHQLPETTEDGRPLYSFQPMDICVIFSREDIFVVHDLYRDPSSPPLSA